METSEIAERVTNANRKIRLEWYEKEAMKALNSLAGIFRQLRDDPLKPYLATHNSFEEYCRERWKMSPRRTQQLIAADNLRLLLVDSEPELEEDINKMSENELRELITTPPEKRIKVVKAAIKAAKAEPRGMTARVIKKVKARIVEGVIREPVRKLCPACGKPI